MVHQNSNDEISIAEILLKLWAHKFLFIVLTFIFVCCSLFYIANAEKIYTSRSVFIPEIQRNPDGLERLANSQLSGVRDLVKMTYDPSSAKALIERFTGRDFVLEIADELRLRDDRFFNNHNAKTAEPIWKTKLKSLINLKNTPHNPTKIAEWNVLQNFKNHIKITGTDAGALQIDVNHVNPEKAAEISNHIMKKSISVLNYENIKRHTDRINYLSQNLAQSQMNYEKAEENLKQFMLSNNTASPESFYKGSIMLDNLRSQREQNKKQIETIEVLLSHVQNSSPTFQKYADLRNKYPLLDQSDFRRLLGLSEIISAWSWPNVETLTQVLNVLRDRASLLETDIREYEQKAIKFAISAEEQNKLQRALKVADAVNKLLIEQVKMTSISAGFFPDTSRIISTADAAITESRPKKSLIITLAAILGIFCSALLALLISWNNGVFYSSGELLKAIDPQSCHNIGSLKYYSAGNLKDIEECLIRRPAPWLKQLILQSSTNRGTAPILVSDTTNFNNASLIARLLAISANEFDMSVAYFDLSKTLQSIDKKQVHQVSETKNDIEVAEINNGFIEYNYQGGKQNVDWLFSKSFQETMDFLNTNHDIIILSANLDVLDLLHASAKLIEAKIIIHALKGKTTYENIHKLNALGNIEVALLS